MAVEVSVDNLGKEIVKQLELYTEEVEEKVAQAVIDVGKESAKKLKNTTSVAADNGKKSKTWTKYPRSWSVKNVKRKGKQIAEVHNKEHYRLTHLLENGHVIKNGTGREYGNTHKFVHIKPVESSAEEELDRRIKEAIEG